MVGRAREDLAQEGDARARVRRGAGGGGEVAQEALARRALVGRERCPLALRARRRSRRAALLVLSGAEERRERALARPELAGLVRQACGPLAVAGAQRRARDARELLAERPLAALDDLARVLPRERALVVEPRRSRRLPSPAGRLRRGPGGRWGLLAAPRHLERSSVVARGRCSRPRRRGSRGQCGRQPGVCSGAASSTRRSLPARPHGIQRAPPRACARARASPAPSRPAARGSRAASSARGLVTVERGAGPGTRRARAAQAGKSGEDRVRDGRDQERVAVLGRPAERVLAEHDVAARGYDEPSSQARCAVPSGSYQPARTCPSRLSGAPWRLRHRRAPGGSRRAVVARDLVAFAQRQERALGARSRVRVRDRALLQGGARRGGAGRRRGSPPCARPRARPRRRSRAARWRGRARARSGDRCRRRAARARASRSGRGRWPGPTRPTARARPRTRADRSSSARPGRRPAEREPRSRLRRSRSRAARPRATRASPTSAARTWRICEAIDRIRSRRTSV